MEPVSISQEEWTSFFEELKKESDRAAAILVVAYILKSGVKMTIFRQVAPTF